MGKKATGAGETVAGRVSEKLVTVGDPLELFPDLPRVEDFAEAGSDYLLCDEEQFTTAKRVGEALIRAKLTHLLDVPIAYLWKAGGGTRNGRAVFGRAARVSALLRVFIRPKGFVILSADHVRNAKMTRFQVEALIYHELMHFRFDEGQLSLGGHDFEAFHFEVAEYGKWRPDLASAHETFKQLDLIQEAGDK